MFNRPARLSRRARFAVSLPLAFALLSGQTPAIAAPSPHDTSTTCSADAHAPVDVQPTPEMTAPATQRALTLIESGDVQVHARDLRTDDSTAYTVTAEGETLNAVTIPVAGDYSYTSNVTILTDDAGDVVRYSETLVDESADETFRVRVFNDGQLTKEENTDLEFMGDDELRAASEVDPGEPVVDTYGVGSTVACLAAVAGIGGPVAYLIASACAGACVGVATGVGAAVCAACIGGYATLGAGGMTAAASCFK